MNRKTTKKVNEEAAQPFAASKRTLNTILNEYKVISMKLFKLSDGDAETHEQREVDASEQAKLLDAQQSLLIEAQSMKIKNGSDVFDLLELWKADEIYSDQVTPSQGVVLHLRDYFEQKPA